MHCSVYIFPKILPLTADYDYRPLSYTLTFEPSDMTGLEQCLEIEIIDDALAEDWEIFTVQLSTDSSAVNLTLQEFDVHIVPNDGIIPNDGKCIIDPSNPDTFNNNNYCPVYIIVSLFQDIGDGR